MRVVVAGAQMAALMAEVGMLRAENERLRAMVGGAVALLTAPSLPCRSVVVDEVEDEGLSLAP